MASYRPKVLNSTGIDALLDNTDNLQLSAAPTANNHGTNKAYVDTSVSTEASARSSADTTLQSNIDSEASTRASADTTLQSNIDTEASTRSSADTTLQSNIDALDTDLQGQIDTNAGNISTIDGLYVRDTGDNMSGNLTLGTTQITLNATDGSGTFAGSLEAASVDGGSY